MKRPARVILSGVALAVAAVVVAVVAWLSLPGSRALYADGRTIHEPASDAPVRSVLWEPAHALEGVVNTSEDEYEPRLSADGMTLYFVRGKAGKNADIYISTRGPQGWSEPKPAPFNSGDDDLGPEPSADGTTVYFYSNRPGGQGGYDLWAAHRDGDRWQDPVNLGPGVNTEFNEYSPALSPDGLRLYFASNRPRPGEGPGAAIPTWPATVRESRGGHDYDLFAAPMESGRAGKAEALSELNTTANEGTPAVSPAGDFLYFSSDRAGGFGGFDLWRSRIADGKPRPPENLGRAINTLFNELDPALSLAGFGIHFSSDRPLARTEPAAPGADQPPDSHDYNLYASVSREVYRERQAADWAGLWAQLWPKLIWLLLSLLALLLLIALIRDGKNRHLSILAKCLLASLAVHAAIMFMLNFWRVAGAVGKFLGQPGSRQVHLTEGSGGVDALAGQIRGESASGDISLPEGASVAAPSVFLPAASAPQVTPARHEVSEASPLEADAAESRPDASTVARVQTPESPEMTVTLPQPAAAAPVQEQAAQTEERRTAAIPALTPAARAAQQPTPMPGPSVPSTPTGLAVATVSDVPVREPSTARPAAPSATEAAGVRLPAAEQVAAAREAAADVTGGERGLAAAPPITPTTPPGQGRHDSSPAPTTVAAGASLASAAAARVSDAPARGPSPAQATVPSDAEGAAVKLPAAEQAAPAGQEAAPNVTGGERGFAAAPPIAPAAQQGPGRRESTAAPTQVTTGTSLASSAASDAPSAVAPGGSSAAPTLPSAALSEGPSSHLAIPSEGHAAASGGAEPSATQFAGQGGGSAVSVPVPSAVPGVSTSGSGVKASVVVPGGSLATGEAHESLGSATTGGTPAAAALPELISGGNLALPHETGAPTGVAEATGPPRPSGGGESGPVRMPGGAGPAPHLAMQGVQIGHGPAAAAPGPGRLGGSMISGGERGLAEAPASSNAKSSAPALADHPPTALRLPTETAPTTDPYAQRSPETRQQLVERLGGSKETEEAVARALTWLAAHQSADGRWSSGHFDDQCGKCGGATTIDSDTAATGLALLCFMAADHSHVKDGPYKEAVAKGIHWLVSRQSESGDLRGQETMYSHGIAAITLAEAYGLTHDPDLARPVAEAVGFIVQARNKKSGGWRYDPGQAGDTSVLGWQVMALSSAKRAGVEVPQEAMDAASAWLDKVTDGTKGLYSYQPHQPHSVAMTAEGMFVQQLLGHARDEEPMQASAKLLMENLPKWGRRGSTYYWYYATLSLFQHGGDEWTAWNAAVTKELLEHQRKDGAAAGSWDPLDQWARVGGRVYQTALCTLSLEVYYRYLPMYGAVKR